MKLKIKNISISVTFPAVALVSLILITGYAARYLLCFVAVILHEAGHFTAMVICNNKPTVLKISAFDVKIIENQRHITSVKKDLFIAFAGSVTNLTAFSAFIFINADFACVNLFVGLFNLLPCASLDGGQALFLLLSKRLSYETSAKITDIISLIVLFPITVIGIMILFQSQYNFSLLFLGIYLLLSLFLKNSKYL